jgi:DNA polymerase-3 subunit alpha
MPQQFVHLHTHSHYSLLDGAAKVPELVKTAAAYGMPALAITDHGNMFGAMEFYQEAKKAGIKPIIGYEAYITSGNRLERNKEAKTYHITLLAKSFNGYRSLIKLASEAYLNGFYYKPRIDREYLIQHHEGLIALSGCLSSETCSNLVDDNYKEAQATIAFYRDLFGENFFIEVQKNKIAEQEKANDGLLKLAAEFKLPLVLTNDIHYLRAEDAKPHDVLLCIQTATTVNDPKRWRFGSQEFYLKKPEEMIEDGKGFPGEAIDNTLRIADMVDIQIPTGQNHLPPFTPPDGKTNEQYLHELCEKGLEKRYGTIRDEIRARFEYEFKVIGQMGFPTYFLIVWDFINYARSQGIPVGPGRGSAAGSIVAYALGITDLDPLRYNLLFERFLNEGRKEMPDIDVDFETERRSEVIAYVTKKYGQSRVCQIITFGTMAARAAIRDVGRAMNMPLADVDKVAKKMPTGLKMTLEKGLEDAEFRQIYESEPRFKELIDVAKRLEGLNRQPGIHAAGVIIADQDLTECCPMYKNVDGAITTQYSMEHIGTLGLLKMDFLGLSTLTLIQKVVQIVKKSQGVDIDMEKLPLDDAPTYEMLSRGETNGVFQLESEGMRELIKKLRPDHFEDIIALVALYRPGPLGSGMVDTFCRCKHGEEKPAYKHPVLEKIMSETYGVMLYQEQAMQIAKDLSGFTLAEADSLRKAMSKKKKDLMEKYRKKFIEGAQKIHNADPATAGEIFDVIDYFSGYGFNKSHSAAYALVTYQTAYLKQHYPVEFMAALMTIESQNTDKVVKYLHDCEQHKLAVLPPDVNLSEASFSVSEGKIRFGFAAIKGLGGKAIEAIIATRKEAAKFTSIFQLCESVDTHAVDKRVLEALIKSGSLDSFGRPRHQLFNTITNALQWGATVHKQKNSNQMLLFDSDGDTAGGDGSSGFDHLYVNEGETWTRPEELKFEKEMLGFYLSDHPLKRWGRYIQMLASHELSSLRPNTGGQVVVGGMVIALRARPVKSGKNEGRKMAYLTLEDMSGNCPFVCFPDIYEKQSEFLVQDEVIFVKGKMNNKEETEVVIDEVIPIEKAIATLAQRILLRLAPKSEDVIYEVRKLCGKYQGKCRLQLEVQSGDQIAVIDAASKHYVKADYQFFCELQSLLGEEAVVLGV